MSYSLLPAIRNLISNSIADEVLNVVSIACGTALELSTFELLARSRGIKINYVGCDISKSDLRFNTRVLQKKCPNTNQHYIHADIASSPPVLAIAEAHCIVWRHPEFLSDHAEIPKELILKMCQILWNILELKKTKTPILITCYDPHEMMLILELVQQFCEEDLKYSLSVDTQNGRASWLNPMIDSKDLDPLFNLNHHDQCQLLITQCHLKTLNIDDKLFTVALSKAFHTILSRLENCEQDNLSILLDTPNLDALREAASYLNDHIRKNDNPFIRREQLLSLLTEYYEQPELSPVIRYS